MTAAQERERIVAWLREEAVAQRRLSTNVHETAYGRLLFEKQSEWCDKIADAIARGDHLHPSDTAGNEA